LKGGGRLTCVDISKVWLEVAQKRLRKYPNVELKLGDITTLDIPDSSQDAVFISFMLHEVPAEQRPAEVRCTVDKLMPGGKLFIREPLRFISQEEIRKLMRQNGLVETSAKVYEVKTQGNVFDGVYSMPER
jgi:ubiquinone/menaquinone biosynthesis C-methylase UbiE